MVRENGKEEEEEVNEEDEEGKEGEEMEVKEQDYKGLRPATDQVVLTGMFVVQYFVYSMQEHELSI